MVEVPLCTPTHPPHPLLTSSLPHSHPPHTVIQDMVKAMFNKRSLNGLFQPQDLHVFSNPRLKSLFQEVAHSSVMRLHNSAMDKVMMCQLNICAYFHSPSHQLLLFPPPPPPSVLFFPPPPLHFSSSPSPQLYDLMSMSFKYQLLACPRPEDIILVTLNHLDTIKQFVIESESCCEMIDEACRRLNEV